MAHMRSSLMCMTSLMYRWLAADIEDVMFTIRGVANKLGGFTGVAVKSVHSEELWPCCFSVDRDPKDRPGSRLQRGEADSPTCAHLHLDADIPTRPRRRTTNEGRRIALVPVYGAGDDAGTAASDQVTGRGNAEPLPAPHLDYVSEHSSHCTSAC